MATDDGPVGEVLDLFSRRGDGHYGEVVDQRCHALQCANSALEAGGGDSLVAAALLHDIGHLCLGADPGGAVDPSVDDHHEAAGARWVAPRFGATVARTIALHVLAKRYRCTVDPAYLARLSPTSTATLSAQGGLLGAAEHARFVAHPGFDEAMALRFWDERAKVADAVTPGIGEFVPILSRLVVACPDGAPQTTG
jgi:predicted HD phosphohydrolase